MSNIVKVKDFTFNDLKEYVNKRACDGNWNLDLGVRMINFIISIPKGKHKKKDEFVKEHIGEVFNIEDYPNMSININTGEVYKEDE